MTGITPNIVAAMKAKAAVIALVLVAFTAFSVVVVIRHGYFGFATLAYDEGWAAQMLIDLSLALFFVASWLRRDAASRGIQAWPYLVGIVLVGSISPLLYLLHRELKR